ALRNAATKSKPPAVYLAPRADHGLLLLQQHGVASFRTPESCADAVYAYLSWRAPAGYVSAAEDVIAPASAVLAATAADRWNERQSLELFTALGIKCAQS